MVEADNLTDHSYELIEKIERRKMLLTAAVIVCFILAPIGIGHNAHTYLTAAHTKEEWPDVNVTLEGIIFVVSVIQISIGIKKYIVVKDLKSKLTQMQRLEETIYDEVLKSNMHRLE